MTYTLAAPRVAAAAAAAIVAVLAVVHDPQVSLVLLPVVGLLLVVAISRRLSDDRWLPYLGLLNLLLADAVATALYWASSLDHPRLAAMIAKKGFWVFGLDAIYYHERALQIAHSLRHHVLFPDIDLDYAGGFMGFVGLIYAAFGGHPLVMPFVNAILLAISVLLVYWLAARFGSRWAARAAGLAAAVWPSALLWSSQVMKDSVCLFLTLLMIGLTVESLGGGKRWPARILLGLGLFVTGLFLYTLRLYLIYGLLLATAVALALTGLRSRKLALGHLVTVAVIGGSVVAGWALGTNFLLLVLNPTRSPAAVLYREGRALETAGRLAESRDRYQASVARKPDFWPSYRRLGELTVRLNDLPAAEAAFRKYLEVYPLDDTEPAIRRVIDVLAEANRPLPPRRDVGSPVVASATSRGTTTSAPRTASPAARPPAVDAVNKPAGIAEPPRSADAAAVAPVAAEPARPDDGRTASAPQDGPAPVPAVTEGSTAEGPRKPPRDKGAKAKSKKARAEEPVAPDDRTTAGAPPEGSPPPERPPSADHAAVDTRPVGDAVPPVHAPAAPSVPAATAPSTVASAAERPRPPGEAAVDASKMLAGVQCKQYDCGRVTMADTAYMAARFSGDERPPIVVPSLTAAASVRNGFIETGGQSLYTEDRMSKDVSNWGLWLKSSPQAFLMMLGAPYPWQWRKDGKVDPMRVAMGIESLVLVLLLPFAAVASWRIARGGGASGLALLLFFFLFGTILGLIVVNVGTLVRLRLPLIFVASALGAVGLAWGRDRLAERRTIRVPTAVPPR